MTISMEFVEGAGAPFQVTERHRPNTPEWWQDRRVDLVSRHPTGNVAPDQIIKQANGIRYCFTDEATAETFRHTVIGDARGEYRTNLRDGMNYLESLEQGVELCEAFCNRVGIHGYQFEVGHGVVMAQLAYKGDMAAVARAWREMILPMAQNGTAQKLLEDEGFEAVRAQATEFKIASPA